MYHLKRWSLWEIIKIAQFQLPQVFKATICIIPRDFCKGLVWLQRIWSFLICDNKNFKSKTPNTEKSLKYEDYTLNSVVHYSFSLKWPTHMFSNSFNNYLLISLLSHPVLIIGTIEQKPCLHGGQI